MCPRASADLNCGDTDYAGRSNVIVVTVADVHDLIGWVATRFDQPFEKFSIRLRDTPVVGGCEDVARKIQRAEMLADAGGLVAGDADKVASVLKGLEAGAGVVVEVVFGDVLADAGVDALLALLVQVEAGAEDLEDVAVVAALGDDGAEDGGEGVAGDA